MCNPLPIWACDLGLTLDFQYFIDKSTDKNWFVYPWNSFHLWFSTYWAPASDWEYRLKASIEKA
jgi:hypothetical protein